MHQKKSEAQIGKESSGVSSDLNPSLQQHQSSSSPQPEATAPYKRPLFTQFPYSTTLSKSPTLHRFTPNHPRRKNNNNTHRHHQSFKPFQLPAIRRLRLQLIAVVLFFLFYSIVVSGPSHPVSLDFLYAAAFAATAVLLSIQLGIPRLPSIRLFLSRAFSANLNPCSSFRRRVLWTVNEKRRGSGLNGFWVQVYSNGDVYQGEFRKGKCWGSGVYYYSMSGRYEGDWVDGKYEGYGVETWARGSRYRGQFRMGLRHGFGVYRFYTGDVYAGEWSSGQSHGCGVHNCDDGSKYVGEFKWGVKHGLGHYHFRNGDTYAGEYVADKMHGFGVYHFANGHLYEGAWHEGKRQGLGMYTFRNGETQSGHWQNGVLSIPSTQDATYPVSPLGVNHSNVLIAVQEARRAAEMAYDVAKVDERVNRAAAAANRAASAARVAAVKAVQKQMHPHNVNSEGFAIPIV